MDTMPIKAISKPMPTTVASLTDLGIICRAREKHETNMEQIQGQADVNIYIQTSSSSPHFFLAYLHDDIRDLDKRTKAHQKA